MDAAKVWTSLSSALEGSTKRTPSFLEIKKALKKNLWLPVVVLSLLAADFVWLGLGYVILGSSPPRPSAAVDEASKIEIPYVQSKSTYNAISNRNIFCPGCPVPDIKSRAAERPKDCNKARPFVGGGPKLIGTIVLSQPEYSVATVSGGGPETDAIKKGDVYKTYGTVYEIRRDRVCFENADGLLFFTELPIERAIKFGQPLASAMEPQASEGIQRSADDLDVQIQRSYLLKQIQDPNLLYQAQAVPYKVNDEVIGFQLVSINPGSVYEQLGFSAGDVITAINGEPVTTAAKAQQAFASVTTITELNLTVLRGGRPLQRSFKVK